MTASTATAPEFRAGSAPARAAVQFAFPRLAVTPGSKRKKGSLTSALRLHYQIKNAHQEAPQPKQLSDRVPRGVALTASASQSAGGSLPVKDQRCCFTKSRSLCQPEDSRRVLRLNSHLGANGDTPQQGRTVEK